MLNLPSFESIISNASGKKNNIYTALICTYFVVYTKKSTIYTREYTNQVCLLNKKKGYK